MASADETVHPEKKLKLDDGWEEFDYDDDEEDPYLDDWETFSFDMSKFDEHYSDDDFSSLEEKEKFRSYLEQITKSQGFDVEYDGHCPAIGGVVPVEKDIRCPKYARAVKSAQFAIRTHNKQPGSKKLELVDIVRVTDRLVSGYKFYITFLANDISSGEQKTYQAKVYDSWTRRCRKLQLFREKPQAINDASTRDG